MSYYIKEVEKEDLRDFMYVNTNSWNESYRGIVSDDFLNIIMDKIDSNTERLENKFDQEKENEPYNKRFILYVDEEPVGVLGIDKSRDEKYPNSGELTCLYLLNKAKKQGYGKIMFDKAEEELIKQGFTDMIIDCLKENPTNEFYKHMGGQLVSEKARNIGGKEYPVNIYYFDKLIKTNKRPI
ncbi:MAG: GNAT family N-acetyltransferase [Bacilli bacterium]|nr:GNAT family N-acetyltransferase [Bacilli bacterium]